MEVFHEGFIPDGPHIATATPNIPETPPRTPVPNQRCARGTGQRNVAPPPYGAGVGLFGMQGPTAFGGQDSAIAGGQGPVAVGGQDPTITGVQGPTLAGGQGFITADIQGSAVAEIQSSIAVGSQGPAITSIQGPAAAGQGMAAMANECLSVHGGLVLHPSEEVYGRMTLVQKKCTP